MKSTAALTLPVDDRDTLNLNRCSGLEDDDPDERDLRARLKETFGERIVVRCFRIWDIPKLIDVLEDNRLGPIASLSRGG
nr:hypothetical protein [Natrinema versiforme]